MDDGAVRLQGVGTTVCVPNSVLLELCERTRAVLNVVVYFGTYGQSGFYLMRPLNGEVWQRTG